MSEPETPAAPPSDEPPPPPPPPPGGESAGGPPPGGPGKPAGGPPDNRNLMIVLSYLWILALIPLLTEKDEDVQWHAKHGLVLTAAEVALWLVIGLLNAVSGFVGCLLMPVYVIGWLAILGVHIVCMVKGVKGERFLIPGLSQYADRF